MKTPVLNETKREERIFSLYLECIRLNPESVTHLDNDVAIDAACTAHNLYEIFKSVYEHDPEEVTMENIVSESEGKN